MNYNYIIPFIKTNRSVMDALDWLLKYSKDQRWDCMQKAKKILDEYVERKIINGQK